MPWGPALTSASGTPPSRTNAYERVPRSLARLPREVDGVLRVFVDGVLQSDGEDYWLVGRLLVFGRVLSRETNARYWRRVLCSWGMGAFRRRGAVSVAYEVGERTGVVRNLEVTLYGARQRRR